MKSLFIHIAIIIIVISQMSLSFDEGKIDKVIRQLYKEQLPDKVIVDIPDSLTMQISTVCKLRLNDNLDGYACYATAFGCKLGGCAKPSDPNISSYETFDYIVIFNENLAIRKVEIVNYPGAYGYEICRKKWLQQFEGKTPDLQLGRDVDGVTGATVSAQFLVEDINYLKSFLQKI